MRFRPLVTEKPVILHEKKTKGLSTRSVAEVPNTVRRLQFADDLVLLTYVESGFQRALNSLAAAQCACDSPEGK